MFRTYLFLSLALCASAAVTTFEGEFSKLSYHHPGNLPFYWLKTVDQKNYALLFDHEPDNIMTGDWGSVIGNIIFDNDLYRNTINVSSYVVLRKTPFIGLEQVNQTMSSIAFVLKICDKASINKAALQNVWTNDLANTAVTFENYIAQCTFEKYKFPGDRNIIVGPIELPCNSTRYGYDSRYCGGSEVYGWAQHAMDYTRDVLGININNYRYKLFMLPSGVNCGWAGLGQLGCGSSCMSWYYGDYGRDLSVVMHELGHNFGLHHSSTPAYEYGDSSCAMGGCCGNRCYNAPQTWNLGIITPLRTITPLDVNTEDLTVSLPSHLATTSSFLKVDIDQTNAYFISFVMGIKYNQYLNNNYKNKVLVHKFRRSISPGVLPVLQSILSPGSSYTIGEVGLNVRFVGISNNTATVQVCKGSCIGGVSPPPAPKASPPPPAPKASPPPPAPKASPPPPAPKSSPPPPAPKASPPPPAPKSSPPPPAPKSSPPPPAPKSSPPPPARQTLSLLIKVKKEVSNNVIQQSLCPKAQDALREVISNIAFRRCSIIDVGNAKYYNVSIEEQSETLNKLRSYFSLRINVQSFTDNAELFCDSTLAMYKNSNLIFNYKASSITCTPY